MDMIRISGVLPAQAELVFCSFAFEKDLLTDNAAVEARWRDAAGHEWQYGRDGETRDITQGDNAW